MFKRFLAFVLIFIMNTIGFVHAQSQTVSFVPNLGQWEENFLYKGMAASADFYLEQSGITYVVGDAGNAEKMESLKERIAAPEKPVILKYHAYKMKWLGANLSAITKPGNKESYYHNYYLGKDSKRWHSNVSVYGNVTYENLYNNIDLYISSTEGLLKYDFVVKPGGDPNQIQLSFTGADEIQIKQGNLQIQTSVGTISEVKPYAFQYIDGNLKEVKCKYKLKGNVLSYSFPNGYDPNSNLTIDPTIVFASLTGSTADNWGFTATYDAAGNLYAGGIANGNGYPYSTGAFQVSYGGGSSGTMPCDVAISKFNATGTALLYSTYLGGNSDEMPHSMIVDQNNNLIVAGKTMSTNFPTSTNAYQRTLGGDYDIFITKFNANGTALLSSTYIGGSSDDGVNITSSYYGNQNTISYNYGDGFRSEVIIDKKNNVYLAGSTQSSNFPTTGNAVSNTLGGSQDGVFIKLDSNLRNLIYSTYLGGSGDDAAYVISLDTGETNVYVGGGTSSSNFGAAYTSGAWQNSYQGGISDGFIARFKNSGNYNLLRTTFIGTSNYDQVYGLKTDMENGVYAMGQTLGNFPVTSGAYVNPGSPQFIIKLDSTLNTRIYSTVFGSGTSSKPNISPVAFMIDTCQNVYVSGWASPSISQGTSTNNMPITPNAFQDTTDGSDFYFAVFNRNAQILLYATFFGSKGKMEHVDGGTSRFDPQGVVYQAICASCGSGSAYPSTPGAYARQKGSNNCNLGAVKIAFDLGSVKASMIPDPSWGCAPLTVNFQNNSSNGIHYKWDFGDGNTDTSAQPTHIYKTPGVYKVRLIVDNPNSCYTRDTAYLDITVSTDTIAADFNFELKDTCTKPYIDITNASKTLQGHSLSSATFEWDFGDGGTYTGQNPPLHYYTSPGAYNIRLIMKEPDACNNPDTIIKTLIFTQENLSADFIFPDTLCEGIAVKFINRSQNSETYFWSFGDGNTDTSRNPEYTYDTTGTFKIKLISRSTKTCNPVDSTVKYITISSSPKAAFSTTPIQPETNVPISFHNQSKRATRYEWSFGDGKKSVEKNPVHHFPKTGQYNVCLTAYNDEGCYDVVCKKIAVKVEPLADLPKAFSPNGDGKNDVLYVRGYAIETMQLRIFNRWGQLVFESNDINQGWDGTFEGIPQEIEAYAYTLQVKFLDGSTYKKKGNVTLLR